MSIFENWPDKMQGEGVYIVRTTSEHLLQFLSWRKWEGKLDLTNEEESFAHQQERARKHRLINKIDHEKEIALSIFNKDDDLISLVELYLIETEIFVSKWILKKTSEILGLAYEAGELLLQHILSQKYSEINSIFLAIPEYRQESISILLNLGFIESSYYYRKNHKNDWVRMLTFRM